MDLKSLKTLIKKMVGDAGAIAVGIGNRERLVDAPPSADMDYDLPGARSCIIWAYPIPVEVLRPYLGKTERMGYRKNMHFSYSDGWYTATKVAQYIEKNTSYKAVPVVPNAKYRTGQRGAYGKKAMLRIGMSLLRLGLGKRIFTRIMASTFCNKMVPRFSLRYGAVAAGLGRIGWSGNVFVKGFGSEVYLAGVLTTAPLEADPLAEDNTCTRCKACVQACSTGLFSMDEEETPVIIGGRREVYAKRNAYARCYLGCGGLAGLSDDGTWSTWTPDHLCLKHVPEDKMTNPIYLQTIINDLFFSKKTPKAQRKFNKDILIEFMKAGILENAGLRSLEDTHPTCGACQAVCVGDSKMRKELLSLLKTSGKMYVDEEGKEYIKKIDETGKEAVYYPSS